MSEEKTTLDGSECDNESYCSDKENKECALIPVAEYLTKVSELRSRPMQLSETISLIECENGTKVYLIGTAHFSEESIADVRNVISFQKPDIVVLELCQNRTGILSLEKEDTIKQMENIMLFKMLKDFGVGQGLLQYILLRINSYLISQLDMLPGGEFKAALEEAAKQPHFHVILGDRPVSITLYRAVAALGLWERIKFAYCMLFNLGPITKEDVEAIKKGDIVEKIIMEIAGDHPGLIEVLVNERDRYLTKSIYEATGMVEYTQRQRLLKEHPQTSDREPVAGKTEEEAEGNSDADTGLLSHRRGDHRPDSGADTGALAVPVELSQPLSSCCNNWPSPSRMPRVVVAVVGFGHVAGIRRLWLTAEQIDMKELVKQSEPPLSWKMFKWSMRGLLIAVAGASVYGIALNGYRLGRVLVTYFL